MKYPEKYKGEKIISFYSYLDAENAELYVVGRTDTKQFPIFHLASNRHWVFKAPDENIPYKLPELLDTPLAETLFIVEGEKDVETLLAAGLHATTARGGANGGNAYKQWSDWLWGRYIVIIPDNDKPGIKYAEAVRHNLSGVAAEVLIVHLPGVEAKGDVSDWFAAGLGDAKLLMKIVEKAREAGAGDASGESANGVYLDPDTGDEIPPPMPMEPDEMYDASWKDFPVELLPIELQAYILEAARMLSCDPGYIALATITSFGSAIGNSRVCQLNEEWQEPSVFWGCLIASNSTLKSPASDKGAWPVQDLHETFMVENGEAQEVYDKEMEIWKASAGMKQPKGGEAEPVPTPKTPTPRRHMIEDITVEKVAEMLSQNPKGLMMKTDELAGWFGSFARYKSSGISGTDMPFWLKVFGARSHTVDRKGGTRPSIHVPRAAVSVYGPIQHKIVQDLLTTSFFESGFVARILFCMPPKCKKIFVRGGIDAGVKFEYRELFRKLYFIDGLRVFDKAYSPSVIGFSKHGMNTWVEFYEAWAERQFVSFGEIGSALAKLEAYCARFALLFAEIDFVQKRTAQEEIKPAHVEAAFQMVKWFAEEANRVYSMVHAPVERLHNETLVEWIKSKEEGVTPNRLFLSNPSKYKNTEGARQVLNGLVEEGKLHLEIIPPPGGKGYGKTVYLCKA